MKQFKNFYEGTYAKYILPGVLLQSVLIGGGYAAVKLMKAVSDGGLELKTTKDGKGNLNLSLKGHYDMTDTSKVPMEFYVKEAE